MKQQRARLFVFIMLCVLMSANWLTVDRVVASSTCQCLPFIQSKMGLPATGNAWFPAYNYPSFLESYKQSGQSGRLVFRVSKVSPSSSKPSDLKSTMMIWQPNTKGAYGAGHIAQVISATYDRNAKVWTIEFIDANGWSNSESTVKETKNEHGCANVAVRTLKTKSLSGITFYSIRKR